MVWMGGSEEDDNDDGFIPVLDAAVAQADGNLGNTDMANMRTDQSAFQHMNNPHNLQAHGLAGMPNLPSPRRSAFGHLTNKRETLFTLGLGALVGVGIKALWDFRTK